MAEASLLEIKKILVPVDFSGRSAAAAEHAVVMANRFGSDLIFAHVIPLSPYHYGAFESGLYVGAAWPSESEMEATLQRRMSEFVKQVSSGRPVEELVLTGDPAKKIEELAQSSNADLIVLPTHGYGPFRRFILGSVTSKVLHDVACPVFTGAHVPEIPICASQPYKRVACAVDLGEHSETVLCWAGEFAKIWGAELVVIHAAPLLEVIPVDGQYFPADLRQRLNSARRERIRNMFDRLGYQAKTYVESDEVSYFVRSALAESRSDVLVIGRTPRRGLFGRLRTHAYALIRESPCPVISV